MFSASGVAWMSKCDYTVNRSNELEDGKEAIKTFAIYYLHKPESLYSLYYYFNEENK